METDLDRVIRSRQVLSIDHHRFFLYQILRGLKYLHSADLIHCDLKPTNILVSNCDLKICGFGSVNTFHLNSYIVRRHYQAPELFLESPLRTSSVDLWSVGCIFAELLGRMPIFSGTPVEVLRLIVEKLGRPPENECDFITSEKARQFLFKLPNNNPVPLEQLYPEYRDEREALDLLRRMLDFHPRTRCTVEEALSHPFLSPLHDAEDEPTANFAFDFPMGGTSQDEELFHEPDDEQCSNSSRCQRIRSLLYNLLTERMNQPLLEEDGDQNLVTDSNADEISEG
jgi:serine/threonine protein kinase